MHGRALNAGCQRTVRGVAVEVGVLNHGLVARIQTQRRFLPHHDILANDVSNQVSASIVLTDARNLLTKLVKTAESIYKGVN